MTLDNVMRTVTPFRSGITVFRGLRTGLFAVLSLMFLTAVMGVSVSAQTLYGISNGFGTAANNQIYQIDPATGAISNAVQVTLAGFTVTNSLALAYRPTTGFLYAVIQTTGGTSFRRLVGINPATGVCTDIGLLAQPLATLAFRADGTLYGVTGQSGANPETLFTVSTTNASMTLLFALGNGLDGETVAFHPNGLLYHSSGDGTALFESVDVDTQVVTPIGTAATEAFAMGYSPNLGQMFLSDINSNLFTVDIATGARTLVGLINSVSDNRGLAFATAPTAAGVSVSGRLLTAAGRGVPNTIVRLTDTNGLTLTARSSSFGYYRFDDVGVGQTYVISVGSKRYTFVPQAVTVNDELAGFDLIAEP